MEREKSCRRLVCFVLACILFISSTSLLTLPATAEKGETVDKTVKEETDLGASVNSEKTVVVVSTAEMLAEIAEKVNGGDKMAGAKIELANDIQLSGDWSPIGHTMEKTFSGEFDGKGFTISGLSVKIDVNGGLFGFLEDAAVKNLHLAFPTAPNSTAGLFHLAIRSSVEGFTYELSPAPIIKTVSMFSLYDIQQADKWTGVPDYSWFDGKPGDYTIESANQFEAFMHLVNGTRVPAGSAVILHDFAGEKVFLTKDINLAAVAGKKWDTPIGKDDTTTFRGTFNGKNCKIYGIDYNGANDFALFGYVSYGDIMNFYIMEPKIHKTGGSAAAAVLVATGTGVSSIKVIKPVFTGSDYNVGGVVNSMPNKELGVSPIRNALVQGCFVYEPYIVLDGNSFSGGIIYLSQNAGATQNVVYGGVISSTTPGGIVWQMDRLDTLYTLTSQNLVLGTKLEGGIVSAVTNSSLHEWSAVSDNFVSGVTSSSSRFSLMYASRDTDIYGVVRNFTDTTEDTELVPKASLHVRDNYWDDIAGAERQGPDISDYNNRGYSTNYLINGVWSPNEATWFAKENYYPQISALKNSISKHIRAASGLASVALIPEDEFEKYTTGVRKIYLRKFSASGDPIDWVIAPEDPAVKGKLVLDSSHSDYTAVSYLKNDHIPAFSIVAHVTSTDETGDVRTFSKTFQNVQIVDSFLEEDVAAREPAMNATVSLTQEVKAKFIDPIEENPTILDTAKLYIYKRDASGNVETDSSGNPLWTEEQSVPCKASPRFRTEPDGSVFISFSLREGTDYKVVLPEGMVKEATPTLPGASPQYKKKNYSEEMTFFFKTPPKAGAPVINLESTVWTTGQLWEGTTADFLTEQQILNSFSVLESLGGPPIYDRANTGNLHKYQSQHGAWRSDDPRQSMKDILAASTGPIVYYYVDNQHVVDNTPLAGHARIFIMAKNAEQITNQMILDIDIVGIPDWTGKTPEPAVHILWTDDLNLVLATAKQDATAGIKRADGSIVPTVVEVQYDQKEWDKVVESLAYGPQKLDTKLVALDPKNNPAKTQDVVIYLDKPLIWQMTPSPVTMSYTTKSKVEDKMNIVAKTFPNNIVKYHHFAKDKYWGDYKDIWPGSYRKEGLFYVDVTSDPQDVTKCTNTHKNCSYPGDHPNDVVDDSFILNIIRTPDEETTSYWGNIAAEFFSGEYLENVAYSKKSVDLTPKSYLLPDFILGSLLKQKYGKVQMSYDELYRWNLFSDTLDNSYSWSELYNLETNIVANEAVTKLVGSTTQGVQFRFEHTGRLFGKVAFDLNLNKILPIYKKMSNKNLGLYSYDKEKDTLKLVSDVIVTSDNWASAQLSELLPTVYVLKEKADGDKVEEKITDFDSYYLISRTKGKYGEYSEVRDKDHTLIDERKSLVDIEEIITGEESGKLFYAGAKANKSAIVAAVSVIIIAVAAFLFYYYKSRRESK